MIQHNYLEIIEELTEKEMFEKEPQIIRIEVKDELEAQKIVSKYEILFEGLKYKKQFHSHKHSAKGSSPCEIKRL